MFVRAGVSLVLVLAVACASPEAPDLVRVRFETARGVVEIRAEVADEPAEHARGLMERMSLGEDRGMLFVFDVVAVRRFHMRNTRIPLDLVSMRAGRVVAVDQMMPCRAEPCPLTQTPEIDAALEVERGTAARLGIGNGIIVTTPAD